MGALALWGTARLVYGGVCTTLCEWRLRRAIAAVDALDSPAPLARAAAYVRLADEDPELVVYALSKVISGMTDTGQLYALRALAERENPEITKLRIAEFVDRTRASGDVNEYYWSLVLRALEDHQVRLTPGILSAWLGSDRPELRARAIQSLDKRHAEDSFEAAANLFADEEPAVRKQALTIAVPWADSAQRRAHIAASVVARLSNSQYTPGELVGMLDALTTVDLAAGSPVFRRVLQDARFPDDAQASAATGALIEMGYTREQVAAMDAPSRVTKARELLD